MDTLDLRAFSVRALKLLETFYKALPFVAKMELQTYSVYLKSFHKH